MFEEFYGMYGPKEQEVVALIKRCIGGGYHNKGDFWGMTVVTLGMVFCDTGKASPKEERLEWPVTNEERDGERGWGRFRNEQICRLKIRRIKEEWAQNLVARPGASPRWSGLMRTARSFRPFWTSTTSRW